MKRKALIIGIVIVLLLGGFLVYRANAPVSDDIPSETPSPTPRQSAAFGATVTINKVGSEVLFPDGMILTAKEINDSRCRKGVVCVWAGELTLIAQVQHGKLDNFGEEIRVGTVKNKSVTTHGYTITLISATETTATLKVTSN